MKLTIDDLRQWCNTPRFDHPGRKSVVFGESELLPKCYARFPSGALATIYHGEFIPNPPGCVGIRKLPKGVEIVDVSKEAAQ